jgi:hypothetical protein
MRGNILTFELYYHWMILYVYQRLFYVIRVSVQKELEVNTISVSIIPYSSQCRYVL